MANLTFSYAIPEETPSILALFYEAFQSKFQTMLPDNPQKAFYLYYQYFYTGLKKRKGKVIVVKHNGSLIGFLALEGLGVPFFSGNPGLTTIGKTILLVGFRKFVRLFVGMLLIEGYPPSRDLLYINTIIVNKHKQGKGVGTKLVKLAEKIALQRKFKGICLYVDSTNQQALKFYKKLQFKEDSGFGGEFMRKLIGVDYFIYQYKILNE